MVEQIDLKEITLGIELGSTRIKGIIIDSQYRTIASGDFTWENKFEDGNWTYDLEDVWHGLQTVFTSLKEAFESKYNVPLTRIGAIGVSGMMHGYLPFDKKGKQLAPFRTWRNTTTEQAAAELTELMQFNIPQRWSAAHLYQAILNKEAHVRELDYLTTLAGYVHWQLTGRKVLGVGDASGMFPIDSQTGDYHVAKQEKFDDLIKENGFDWNFKDVFPEVILSGDDAGTLTVEGARLLDTTGMLEAGIPLCAPEGDAGTGMVATNSVTEHTGNVSAGTSIFSMIVLDKPLSEYYVEIDMVTTPVGKDVAMVHCNNFTSDINAWNQLFTEVIDALGLQVDQQTLITTLFQQALLGDHEVGNIVHCSYYAGEPITDTEAGRPLFARMPDSVFDLPNFMKSQIYSSLATLKIGMDLLTDKEKVQVDTIIGHGGFFKTEKVGQQIMADALKVPVTLMETADNGGSWGIALLANYTLNKENHSSLESFLENSVFANEQSKTLTPDEEGIKSFTYYMERYHALLDVEKKAIEKLN